MLGKPAGLIAFLVLYQWVLSGCGPMTIRDVEKQAYIPIQGWTLELHEDIDIPPRRTRMFFQGGRLVYGINEREPHCQLRVRDISEQSQSVRADTFAIEGVYGTLDQIVSHDRILLASVGGTIIAGGGNGNGNGESPQMYLYFMTLKSEKQPNVTYLVCGGALEDPPLAEYPTLQEVRAALGNYGTLILPDRADLTRASQRPLKKDI